MSMPRRRPHPENWLLGLFGDGFGDPLLPLRLRIKHVFIQKILRINAHVPWPVHWTSVIRCPDRIRRGGRFPGLAMGCYLDGRNGITIGKNTWIGPRVSMVGMNHDLQDFEIYHDGPPVEIGDHCWLATNVTILSGVTLGNHVVCAAGTVVTKSFPEDDILLAGVPAKIVRRLPPYGQTAAGGDPADP